MHPTTQAHTYKRNTTGMMHNVKASTGIAIAETGTGLNSRLTSSTYRSQVTGNSDAHNIRTPSRAE
eukprot:scaffold169936_cov51-Attheya_sp.AAC.1